MAFANQILMQGRQRMGQMLRTIICYSKHIPSIRSENTDARCDDGGEVMVKGTSIFLVRWVEIVFAKLKGNAICCSAQNLKALRWHIIFIRPYHGMASIL